MVWPFAASSPTASTASATSSSTAPLEQRMIRVTKDDISRTTPEDIKRVRATLTDEQLSSAIRIVLETNRFADVLAASSASAWAEAATGVTEVQMGMSGRVVRDRMSLLYSMLPYVSDEFLTTMGGSYSSLQ
ncbi:hypothetical protein ABB37_08479 [Leptomonas pyrrhocoris]|uniref:Uncharacterized protein n=1 Tax=Leptomonas pyrrhocoris TaxID=157538 RepID=A0A0M9FTF3_LEPPY|nr:hypothetical protein ABB37_08479 [Leptomonas pyrrhocoris]XP_015654046.1 hypothetical protein ABB37_08479 [Leptomonas pyrrhocoris]KPA75606.1 hypothetical protein ABB37_08479 [Leptomonas pyrrhocoris]KPA75607.1 hypothetical protein ABB37_08479 [Leptomonas pyrrhocoris]|eukprot:XP_015654045.1 hypothetical protein ABB37_08479 [Leptomonas pyrrhocoris]